MKYYRDGQEFRESCRTENYSDAKTKLKLAEGTIAAHQPLIPGKIRFSELLDAVVQDYIENGRKSLSDAESRIKIHIRPYFGKLRPSDITARVLSKYRQKRRNTGASNGTINRELAIVGKAFSLSGLPYRPKIEKLKETNVRKGFISRGQVETICKNLPPDVADLILFMFLTAWRKSEAMNLEWRNVDFSRNEVNIEAFASKNDEPRIFPMYQELLQLLQRRRDITDAVEKQKGIRISCVFHRYGYQILDFRRSWELAINKAKLSGTLVHDLRRSAIKIFTEKGISEQVGMTLSGHKTSSVYRRYNIITRDDLKKAVIKLDTRGTISGTETLSAKGKSHHK